MASDYVSGKPIRQEYLEKALRWISKDSIEEYMGTHQYDQNANELWNYFRSVINWVETTFITKKPGLMKKVDWESLYDEYGTKQLNTGKIDAEVKKLLLDDEITSPSGIYPYILTRVEKHLSLRAFPDSMKQKDYELQDGKCAICKKQFKMSEMEADHKVPWSRGGRTTQDNCQILCRNDNREKSGK